MLLLIPFNIILLFTRYLSQFRVINQFKPLLDAFQGSYKDKYYNWVGVHLILRSVFFSCYAFQTKTKLFLSTIVIISFGMLAGYIRPSKNKLVNIKELLLLLNLSIKHLVVVSCRGSNQVVFNVMISLFFAQFCTIALYHFLTYTCHCSVMATLQAIRVKLTELFHYKKMIITKITLLY